MENKLALKNQAISLFDDFFFNDFFDNNWIKRIETNYYQDSVHSFFDEENNQMVITVEAPGFSKEEIEVDTDGTGLSIKGELKNEELKKRIGEKNFSYKIKKIGIDPKSIQAKLKDGILEVRYKSQESKSQKRIEIQ